MKAGIIGGTGKMGRLFVPIFERAGYDVLVSGRSTPLSNNRLAELCDIVIVSVPIHDTVRVIGEIAPVLTKLSFGQRASVNGAPLKKTSRVEAGGSRPQPRSASGL